MQRCQGGLVFKAHRLCESLNSRLESDKEEKEEETALLVGHLSSEPNLEHRFRAGSSETTSPPVAMMVKFDDQIPLQIIPTLRLAHAA